MTSDRSNTPVGCSATAYDNYTAGFIEPYDNFLLRRVIQLAHPRRTRLLDVGTGTGQIPIQLARLSALKHLSLTGVDYFRDMTDLARDKAREAGLGNRITILNADVHSLPFDSESFDIIISRSTLHHWANPVAALAEIFRVLAQGGVALIHDLRRDAPVEAVAAFNDRRRAAGINNSDLSDKFTAREIKRFAECAGIRTATVRTSRNGVSSLGIELRMAK